MSFRYCFALILAVIVTLGPTLCAGSLAAEEPAKPSVPADHVQRAKAGLALFKAEVRGLLATHCLDCHGGKAIKADFNLANREALMDSGYVDETADDSHVMSLLTHEAEPFMPFKKPKLNEKQIASIARWIDLGAPYDKPLAEPKQVAEADSHIRKIEDHDRKFWSFLPLERPPLPEVKHADWVRSPIDRFVLARQEAAGLLPNEAADRRVLIRRAYFDLLGLPPTPEEVKAFVSDTDPEAYAKLIDRLLASPHYGERWARHWMDVARFAESHGYEQDYDRKHAYHYRDFLIRAFNSDMPYDQFLSWQLAGDELAPNDPQAMIATGFLGAGAFPTQLTEAEFESARYDELDDMVGTVGVSMLGLSIGCARCHDHKFDPIGNWDYYRMASTFTTTIRSEIDLDLNAAGSEAARREHDEKLTKLKAELAEYEKQALPVAFRDWLASYEGAAEQSGPWQLLEVSSVVSSAGTKYEQQPDGSWLATGGTPAKEVIAISAKPRGKSLAAIRLEALTHDSLPRKGPGRAPNGNFALGHIDAEIAADGKAEPRKLTLSEARATHQQNTSTLSIAASIDNDPISGWAVDAGGIGRDQAAAFDVAGAEALDETDTLTIRLTFNHTNTKHVMGRFRLSASTQPGTPVEVGEVNKPVTNRELFLAAKASGNEQSEVWQKALKAFASGQAPWKSLRDQIAKLEKDGPAVNMTKVQVTSEGVPKLNHHANGRGFPHYYDQTFFLNRGDVHQKQEPVEQGFLRVLMSADQSVDDWRVTPPKGWTRTSFRRATLANWMTDTQHGAGHLAARVMANRLWQHHFGRGIVSTPNDFGFSGERPTHPMLLDWLASELIAGDWKLKRLHKQIMTSAAYMQAGVYDEQRATVDRENRWLWRREPMRLEAEPIRDSMLNVSGLLDDTMYGPGTLNETMRRRSIYFFIKRSGLIPTMMLFDWPEHLVSIGDRATTTTAPQALLFMNSAMGRQAAESLAKRIESEASGDDTTAKVRRGFQLTFTREPSEAEVEASVAFIEHQRASYAAAGKNGDQLALVDFAQALFSMNEFIYVE